MESFPPSSEGLQVALDADAVIQNNLKVKVKVSLLVPEGKIFVQTGDFRQSIHKNIKTNNKHRTL